jgi:DNA-binding MarR family transcriptional regulator
MTKQERKPQFGPHESIRRYVAELGVESTHGADLMRLVRSAGHLYDAIMTAKMRDEQLSIQRMRLLWRLFGHECQGGEWLNPTQLSKGLGISKNTVSAHIRALEESGLLEREVDSDDLRQFQIRLSEAGRELLRRLTPGHITFMNDLIQELAPDEIEQLQQLLMKLLASLHRHGCAPNGECGHGEHFAQWTTHAAEQEGDGA